MFTEGSPPQPRETARGPERTEECVQGHTCFPFNYNPFYSDPELDRSGSEEQALLQRWATYPGMPLFMDRLEGPVVNETLTEAVLAMLPALIEIPTSTSPTPGPSRS